MTAAVTLIIFNRPDTTQRVFDAIARAKPTTLLVIADGPRAGRPGEAERCAAARAIIAAVDWDCRVLTNYSPVNLGCRGRVSSGLDWVFSEVEESIILEDDCVPHPDFFSFAEAMLDRYRHDESIMAVGGSNLSPKRIWGDGSYYFSRHCHIWGWATWRRAWREYDVAMTALPALIDRLDEYCPVPAEADHWREMFRLTHAGLIDTWDYQWQFAVTRRRGLTIVPNANLVSNIGFRPDATHTKLLGDRGCAVPYGLLGTLRHPREPLWNEMADRHFFRIMLDRSLPRRIKDRLTRGWKTFRHRSARTAFFLRRQSAGGGGAS
jgi:hypothetical protein